MAQSTTLDTFNPFIVHGFTNNNAVDGDHAPPQPSKYPRPIPSSTAQYLAGTPPHMQAVPRQPSSTNTTVHSPQPRRPITLAKSQQSSNAAYPKPIFTTFQQDRSSPELEEILLRKKLTKTLGHVALGR